MLEVLITHKKTCFFYYILYLVTDCSEIYCYDHFTMYTHIEKLWQTPKTIIILCQLYLNLKIKSHHICMI